MFTKLLLGTLLAIVATVHADPNPTLPGPDDIFLEGGPCNVAWDPDTTGTWKVMNIQLMTGSNLDMKHITTVATVDGTDSGLGIFSFTCPKVVPHSAVYFYQFTTSTSDTKFWTTRFTITDAQDDIVPPTNPTQPDGDNIPWGTGALQDPSTAIPPPPGVGGSNASSQAQSANSSSTALSSSTRSLTSLSTATSAPVRSLSPSGSPGNSSRSSSASASQTDKPVDNSAAVALGIPFSHTVLSCVVTLLGFAMMI